MLTKRLLLLMGKRGITYLLRDEFSDGTLAAGSVNGTVSIPGPGTRVVVDTDNKISISGSEGVCSGAHSTPVFGDPRIMWIPKDLTRKAGRSFIWKFTPHNVPALNGIYMGLSKDPSASVAVTSFPNLTLRWSGSSTMYLYDGTNTYKVGVYAVDTDYQIAVVERGTGIFFFIKGGLFTNWTLIYPVSVGTDAALYPVLYNNNMVFDFDDVVMYDLGKRWTTDNGIATAFSATPSATAEIVSNQDSLIEFTWEAITGEVLELDFRRLDANNRMTVRCSQADSTIKLIKITGGVETEMNSAAQTLTNGVSYRIVVRNKHLDLATWVNNVAKNLYQGGTGYYLSGGNIVKTSHSGTNLIAWPLYVDVPSSNELTVFNIQRAFSEKAADHLALDTYDESDECTHPSVYDAGSGNTWNSKRYWMAMTPLPGGSNLYENPSILCSDDGTTWTIPAGLTNPIDPTPEGGNYNSDPNLTMVGERLYCIYREAWATNDLIRIRSSLDGVDWGDESALFTAAKNACISPTIIEYDGQYLMFSVDASTGYVFQRRTCATIDGTWSDPVTITLAGDPASTIWHFDVVNDGGRLFMVFNNTARDFIIAYSDDIGITWSMKNVAILAAGGATWDAYLYKPSLVRKSNGFDMWYGAYEGSAPTIFEIGRTSIYGI